MLPTPCHEAVIVQNYRRVRAVNSTDSSFPSLVPTLTKPSGAGVVLPPTLHWSPRWAKLVPFGTDADNETFDFRLVSWNAIGNLWVPTILFQATATLSGSVGVAGADVAATERFADTIASVAAGKGVANVDYILGSPADDTPAHVLVMAKGAQLVEVQFDLGTAAGANALLAWM